MLAHVRSCTLHGVDAQAVRVEVNVSSGLPTFVVVGLPQGAVREGRERVAAALRNCGFPLPPRRVTVNLAPADTPKDGAALDLAIAIGILGSTGVLPREALRGLCILGELGLGGEVRAVPGVLPAAVHCRSERLRVLVVPRDNAGEAAVVQGQPCLAVATLSEAVERIRDGARPDTRSAPRASALSRPGPARGDLSEVRGQPVAKRAMEVCAAGGHHLLWVGPPGVGKTMLTRRLPDVLPPMSSEEALETSRVWSAAGLLTGGSVLEHRPFRAPHHSVSHAGLVGGGRPLRPGELSLAHNGVLFLDELPEFRRNALEALRVPLEEGHLDLARASGNYRLPSRFVLVAAMNPCPCGYWGDGTDRCRCDPATVQRYRGRVSGPLLDRIDLRVELAPPAADSLSAEVGRGESSRMRIRVRRARALLQAVQDGRAAPLTPSDGASRLLEHAFGQGRMSARSWGRTLSVARTIAVLDDSAAVESKHIAEALTYRGQVGVGVGPRVRSPQDGEG